MDELFTRCPTCRTVFRTREDQLAVQAGKVRCGHCRMVFDGRSNLVDLHPQAQDQGEVTLGPPTVTLRTSVDLEPVPAEDDPRIDPAQAREPDTVQHEVIEMTVPPARPGEQELPPPTVMPPPSKGAGWPVDGAGDPAALTAWTPAASSTSAASGIGSTAGIHETAGTEAVAGIETGSADPSGRSADAPAADTAAAADLVTPYHWLPVDRERQRRDRWTYGTLALLLAAGLAVQTVHHFRNAIAAQYPSLRPDMVATCALFGCTIEPTHYRDDITIESHDLQADPAHQGLLILQTTLRNRASHPVAFPHLELELDDLGGQPLLRRVFPPVEYAGAAADFTIGIPANGEWNVKLFLDASAISAGGYKLYVFYL